MVGPASRGETIAGLLGAWQAGRSALLAPNEAILARLQPRPQGQIRFLEWDESRRAESELTFSEDSRIATLLTSGSTGGPQLFFKSARQLFGEAILLSGLLQLGESSTVLSTTACHHVYGLLFSVLAPWAGGSRLVTDERNEPGAFHPDPIADLVTRHEVTHLITVPAHLRALLQAPIRLGAIRTVVCSAAALDPRDAKAFEDRFSVEVVDVLGSTETGGIATRRPAASKSWSPLSGVEVHLGQHEQLMIRSPFLEHPEVPYESGDRARIHADGTFEHLGRTDGVIKVGGKRISRQEIEVIAKELVGVKDAACISRQVSGLRGEEVLLAAESGEVDAAAIKKHLRTRLDPVFVPRRIRVVNELPRTDRGKIHREALEALFSRGTPSTQMPHSVEARLAADSVRFSGHFPTDPLLPALAQLTDLVLPHVRRTFGGGDLLELSRVKWTIPLRPGAQVKVLIERKGRGVRFEILLASPSGDESACSGTLVLDGLSPSGIGAGA